MFPFLGHVLGRLGFGSKSPFGQVSNAPNASSTAQNTRTNTGCGLSSSTTPDRAHVAVDILSSQQGAQASPQPFTQPSTAQSSTANVVPLQQGGQLHSRFTQSSTVEFGTPRISSFPQSLKSPSAPASATPPSSTFAPRHASSAPKAQRPTPFPEPDIKMEDAEPSNISMPLTPPSSDSGAESGSPKRAKREPVSQKDRQVPTKPKRDYAAEVEIEEDDGTLPEGYSGTVNGIRYYQPQNTAQFRCGDGGTHELACGHWINDGTWKTSEPIVPDSPCGLNCKTPSFDATAFACPECTKTVEDILANDLTPLEKQKLDQAKKGGHEFFIIAYITEFVTKRNKLTEGITEIIMALAKPDYGRKCSKAIPIPPDPIKFYSPAEWLEIMDKYRQREAFKKANAQAQGQKRKAAEAPSTFDDVFNPKRVATAPRVTFGKPSFMVPPPHVVGALVRKRKAATAIDAEIIERHMKRGRTQCGEMRDGGSGGGSPGAPFPEVEEEEEEL